MSLPSLSLLNKGLSALGAIYRFLSGAKSTPLEPKQPLTDAELGWAPKADDEEPKAGPAKGSS